MIFHQLCETYLESMVQREERIEDGVRLMKLTHLKSSYANCRRIVDTHFAQWSQTPTTPQIKTWHQAWRHRPHEANKALSVLKTIFNWSMGEGYCAGPNPATGVKRHPTFSRERVMNEEEIAKLVKSLDLLPQKMAAILTVLLLTGCRLTEARSMRWEHVNLITGAWLQPQTKNGRPHTTYLPDQARQRIAGLPGGIPYVFQGLDGQCWSRSAIEKIWRQVRESLGLEDVRLHDFRRTLATSLYAATKDEYLVKRCLNHVNPSVTAIYVRITQAEVAAALQAQADRWLPVPRCAADMRDIRGDVMRSMDDAPHVGTSPPNRSYAECR